MPLRAVPGPQRGDGRSSGKRRRNDIETTGPDPPNVPAEAVFASTEIRHPKANSGKRIFERPPDGRRQATKPDAEARLLRNPAFGFAAGVRATDGGKTRRYIAYSTEKRYSA